MQLSYKRLGEILSILLRMPEAQYISANNLAERLGVTSRTIRSDIKEINDEIASYHISVQNRRGHGFYFKYADRQEMDNLRKDVLEGEKNSPSGMTYNERLNDLKHWLFRQSKVNIDELLDDLLISDTTLNSYVNAIRHGLAKFGLKVERHNDYLQIAGSEEGKRDYILRNMINRRDAEYVVDVSDSEEEIFDNVDLQKLSQEINGFLDKNSYRLADINRKNFLIHMALSISRIKKGASLDKVPSKNFVLGSTDKVVFENFLMQLESDFNVKFNAYEQQVLEYHFAMNYPRVLRNSSTSVRKELIEMSIEDFLERIQEEFGIDLSGDDDLKRNLQNHLQLLLKVNRVNGKRKNPMLDLIFSTFPYSYEITAVAAPVLENDLHISLNQDELSFLTLHIGAAVERTNKTIIKRKAALVCSEGKAMASLLKSRLMHQFDTYLTITGIYSYDDYLNGKIANNDFLISTVPITDSNVPIIQIDLANFHDDIKQLYEYLQSITNPYQVIGELLDERYIYLIDNADMTRDKIINLMVDNLEKNQDVTQDFRSKVFKREEMYSTAVGGHMAIPHAIGFETQKSIVSFTRLSQPIEWDDHNEVNYIFLLSISRDDYLNVQKFFDFLIGLQTNQQFRKIIDSAKNATEIKQAIVEMIDAHF
ncbi:transcriptional regulator [Lactobacillus nasalidis]|uniref:Transcriptional regulator n=2 Tax=Lactobacillus nasalidis TaxID=2797258 RepID=A0ABQ3W7T0_9LACO|nr:transcriptional regulator [Lactobacillus nasalidis]GHV99711.1 transcriptional regulator [Lactobacillus nasalidis]GHW02143.1 transcriptional regulator [Lactobacillus nasalidis]